MNTLSIKEQLQELEHLIAQTERLELAEAAFQRTNADGAPNPWAGASVKLQQLRQERDDLLLQERGERLNRLLTKAKELRDRLDALHIQRAAADRQVAERAQHEAVIRFRNAPSLLMREQTPWGHSFEIWRPWFLSGRSLRDGAPECTTFFLHSPEAKAAGVSFNLEGDRTVIRMWLEAKHTADLLLIEENSVRELLRALQRENPEIQGIV